MKYSLQVGIVGASSDMGGREMPGTYNKMEEGEERDGGRRHKHRHHSHHRHRGEREGSRHGRQTSTDTGYNVPSIRSEQVRLFRSDRFCQHFVIFRCATTGSTQSTRPSGGSRDCNQWRSQDLASIILDSFRRL